MLILTFFLDFCFIIFYIIFEVINVFSQVLGLIGQTLNQWIGALSNIYIGGFSLWSIMVAVFAIGIVSSLFVLILAPSHLGVRGVRMSGGNSAGKKVPSKNFEDKLTGAGRTSWENKHG